MGREWDPDRFVGNPNAEQYQVDGFAQTELPLMRLQNRRTLLKQVDAHFGKMDRSRSVNLYDKYQQQAFDLMTSGKARRAFDIAREPSKVRERYGRNRWGQCVLLARRLIEAGARLVHVQWPREPGDNAVDNPLWDTHAQNAERMEDVLAPQFDVGFSALVEDLDQRGLLEETLVVAIGEFGRTPKINNKGGRDHWGPVFSFVMAGAGISGGQVFGASDKSGGYPVENRIEPGDLTATIFHLTGLEPHATFFDKEGRVHHYSRGKPIDTILGHEPATEKRIESTGDPARVPVFDESAFLLAPDFQSPIPIKDAKESSRPRGWRATPLLNGNVNGFGVRVHDNHVSLGVRVRHSDKPLSLNKGTVALLAQEIRSPFAGAFTAKIDVKGLGDSQVFAKHFRSRLIFFQYQARNKNAMQRAEQASLVINPKFDSDWQSFELTKVFTNPNPGQNFSFGLGLGLAVIVEKMTVDVITQPEKDGQAMLLINSIKVEHNPKPRNEKVKV